MARRKRSYGGRTGKMHVMNGEGSPLVAAAKKTSGSGFARGGAPKRAEGGAVGGAAAAPRMDKRARGGSLPAYKHGGSVRGMKSAGGSPMSSGHSIGSALGSSNAGHEGESVESE